MNSGVFSAGNIFQRQLLPAAFRFFVPVIPAGVLP